MGTIGSGEAYDHHVPDAKQIGDPQQRMGYAAHLMAAIDPFARSLISMVSQMGSRL